MEPRGNRLSPLQVAAAVFAGTVALVVLGLQPLLYAAYVIEGAIPEQRLGLLGAAEIFAIAGFSGIAVRACRRVSSRYIALAGVALLVFGNALTAGSSEPLLFLLRFIAGSGAGLLVGLAAIGVAHTQRVGAWAGAFLFGQAASQYAVMTWFANYMPGASGAQIQLSLAAFALIVLFLLPVLPQWLHPEVDASREQAAPSRRGWIGLAAMFFCAGGAGGVWAYVQVWMQSRGVAQADAAQMLSLALLGQIFGALGGAAIADGRWAWLRLLIVIGMLMGFVLFWLGAPGAALMAVGFGVTFMLAAPSLTGVLTLLDKERGALPYGATAQLSGIAIVPTLAGEILTGHGLDWVIVACATSIAIAALLLASQVPHFLRASRAPTEIPPRRSD